MRGLLYVLLNSSHGQGCLEGRYWGTSNIIYRAMPTQPVMPHRPTIWQFSWRVIWDPKSRFSVSTSHYYQCRSLLDISLNQSVFCSWLHQGDLSAYYRERSLLDAMARTFGLILIQVRRRPCHWVNTASITISATRKGAEATCIFYELGAEGCGLNVYT